MADAFRGTHIPVFLPGNGRGTIRAWFVRENDPVTRGQKLAEIVPEEGDEDVLSSEVVGMVGNLTAKLGVPIENTPVLDIIVDQQKGVECYSTPKVSRSRTNPLACHSSGGKYDTAPIVAAILQLQRKRADVDATVARLDSAAEKEFYKDVLDEIDDQIKAKRVSLLELYKELKFKEQRKYNSGYLPFSLPRQKYEELTRDIPRWHIHRSGRERPLLTALLYSDEHECPKEVEDRVYGFATSTYPVMKNIGRFGEPICDQFRVLVGKDNIIVGVADGCNWGFAPAEAARRASKGFVDMINRERFRIINTHRLSNLMLSAMCSAHNAIIQGDDPDRRIGTTTLLGAMIVKIEEDEDGMPSTCHEQDDEPESDDEDGGEGAVGPYDTALHSPRDTAPSRWAVVIASIGDCKAFVYTPKERTIIELTPDSRNQNASDASDCGGRLGPYVDDGPDLRNLSVYVDALEEDDILFICSDGVHDNFDPQHFGISPRELGLDEESWKTADPDEVNAVKSMWRQRKMMDLIGEQEVTPRILTERFIAYCRATTRPSQEFMQTNPGKKLPSDYVQYPGKMDHTTLVAVRVGEIAERDLAAAKAALAAQRARLAEEKAQEEAEKRAEEERVRQEEEEREREERERARAEQEAAERARRLAESDGPKTLVQHVKNTALCLKRLSAVAKAGGDLEMFEAATDRAVRATTGLLEFASCSDTPQDVSMVKAISAKAIVGSKKLYAHRYASDEERAAYAAQLDKLLAGSATVLKQLVQSDLQANRS